MYQRVGLLLSGIAIWTAGAVSALAQTSTGAITSGNWNDGTIWTGGSEPGAGNDAYIGSYYPAGSAATATVTLTQNEAASDVYLGNGGSDQGTLNLGSNTLTISGGLFIGNYGVGSGVIQESPGGGFSAGYAEISGENSLNLGAHDTVSSIDVSYGGSVTTSATGNITGSFSAGNIYASGGSLNLGADLKLSDYFDMNGGTVTMNGHNISAGEVDLGSFGFLILDRGASPGSITAPTLNVGGGPPYGGISLNLIATDSFTNVTLNSSTLTTAGVGNITGNISLQGGSTLNLGANLNISGTLSVLPNVNYGGTYGSILMNGNSINANVIDLGFFSPDHPVTLDRGASPGALTATTLYVGSMTLNLTAADSFVNAGVLDGSMRTAAASNITGSVSLYGATMTLGANLNLSASLDIEGGSTVDAQQHAITADSIFVGFQGPPGASLINTGNVQTNSLYLGNSSDLTLHGGDVVNSLISLSSSVLTVQQTDGSGLTFNGGSGSLLFQNGSQMDLIFTLNTSPNWDFRWLDPAGGNWISTLQAMIADNQIEITAPQGYWLFDDGVYTYLEGGYAASLAPEPSSLVIACVAGLGLGLGAAWKRRHTLR